MSNDANTSAGLEATWPGLNQLQQLIHEGKVGMLALQSLVSTPAAATATGSPPASAALVALGIELVAFLAEIGEAMEHDIQSLEKTARNYQATEADVVTAAAAVVAALAGATSSSTGTSTGTSTSTAPAPTSTTTSTSRTPSTTTRTRTVPRQQPSGTRDRVVTTGATR